LIFIESSLFERQLPCYLADEEYSRVQGTLRRNPNLGVLIPGSGGLRKLRWGREGIGKRGGVRIIYAVRETHEIWLLTIYGKSDIANIPAPLLRAIKREMEHG
jgi:mRNA-degrading endonuclease RelE of RelBE toxin-antitoxin system